MCQSGHQYLSCRIMLVLKVTERIQARGMSVILKQEMLPLPLLAHSKSGILFPVFCIFAIRWSSLSNSSCQRLSSDSPHRSLISSTVKCDGLLQHRNWETLIPVCAIHKHNKDDRAILLILIIPPLDTIAVHNRESLIFVRGSIRDQIPSRSDKVWRGIKPRRRVKRAFC